MTAKEIIEMGMYEVAVNLMDNEIREQIHAEMAPCSNEEFLARYIELHEKKFGDEFTI